LRASSGEGVGIDIGEGTIVRYDEAARKIVGLTIVGVGERVEKVVDPRQR
jgi:hypothetical protein